MMAKNILALVLVLMLSLGVVSLGFGAEAVSGKITKIEGNNLTIKLDEKEVKVEVKSAEGLKVGDNVKVKDGIAKKKKVIEGC